jgi:hypothetical protein
MVWRVFESSPHWLGSVTNRLKVFSLCLVLCMSLYVCNLQVEQAGYMHTITMYIHLGVTEFFQKII